MIATAIVVMAAGRPASGLAAVTPGVPGPSPVCDASRAATWYHPDGTPAAAGSTLVPCRYDVGAVAMEPSFVFAGDGRVLYQTWGTSAGTVGGLPAVPGVVRSSLDWTRWEAVTPAGVALHPNSLDPYIYRDPYTGRIFTVDFAADGSPLCAAISYSDNSGDSWITSPAACGGFDGESIGAGPPVTSTPVGYPDLVYYCTGTTLGSSPPTSTPECSKSLDGGLTFTPTGTPPFPLAGPSDVFGPWAGNPVVGRDGTVYLPKRFGGQPELAISHDEGATWTQVMVASNGASGEATRMAIDNSGAIYYTWTATDHLPYLAHSADGGAHWSAPLRVSPPGLKEAALPRVAAEGAGRVALVYLGSTNAPGHEPFYADCNVLLSDCTDGPYAGAAWNGYMTLIDSAAATTPALATATVNRPDRPLFTGGCSADGACKGVLDFLDVHFDHQGMPWGAFVDDCQLTRQFTPVFNAAAGPCEDGVGEGILGRLTVSRAPPPPAIVPTGGGTPTTSRPAWNPLPLLAIAVLGFVLIAAKAYAPRRTQECLNSPDG